MDDLATLAAFDTRGSGISSTLTGVVPDHLAADAHPRYRSAPGPSGTPPAARCGPCSTTTRTSPR